MEKGKSKGLIFLIIILMLLVLGLGGYIIYDKVMKDKNSSESINDKNEEKNTNLEKKENIEEDNNNTVKYEDSTGINYDELEKELIDKINSDSNTNVYLSTCEDFNTQDIVISTTSISEVIKKLKTADSVEEIATSTFCPAYRFSITSNKGNDNGSKDLMSIVYGYDRKILLVGINDTGYAYHFASENELDHFLENLK